MTRRRLASLLATALAGLVSAAHGQISGISAPPGQRSYVFYAAESQTVPAGKRAMLELRFHMLPGYHVNSHTPTSEMLIPTTLTLQPAAGVKTLPLVYPAGHSYSFSFDPGDKLDVYMGDFTVMLPVVAQAGQHTVDGSLRYQACDNASCYPPRTLPVKVVFTAK